MNKMRMLSLCSGIGGIDIAAEWAGMEIVGQVENDLFCQKILAKNWPLVTRLPDLRTTVGNEFGRVDIVAGGIPCQGNSVMGNRHGNEDPRALWPYMCSIIEKSKATWAFLENVPGILSVNDGKLFQDILQDVARIRYSCAWIVYPASAVQAPHIRERMFLIAHKETIMGNTTSTRQKGSISEERSSGPASTNRWESKPRMGRTIHGLSDRMDSSRFPNYRGERQFDYEPPRVTYTVQRHTEERLRALGNAVVPLQVYPILAAIVDAELHSPNASLLDLKVFGASTSQVLPTDVFERAEF